MNVKWIKKNIIIACTVLGAAMHGAQPAASDEQVDEAVSFTQYAITEDSFRRAACETPDEAVRSFFTPRSTLRWNQLAQDFSTEQLRDFFLGAVTFRGPLSLDGAVCAFYNPWWDAILLLESSGLPEVPKFNRFYLLAGEVFRGDKIETPPAVRTVVPGKLPITVEVCRNYLATLGRFEKMYVSKSQITLLEHPESSSPENLTAIQCRSGLRLKMIAMLIENKAHYKDIYQLAHMLRSGEDRDFLSVFTTPENLGIIKPFVGLDKTLRRGFVPYGYVPTVEGRLYVFVNGDFPRLFTTMTLGGGWRKTIFEWYDIAQSDKILAIWGERKEVAK